MGHSTADSTPEDKFWFSLLPALRAPSFESALKNDCLGMIEELDDKLNEHPPFKDQPPRPFRLSGASAPFEFNDDPFEDEWLETEARILKFLKEEGVAMPCLSQLDFSPSEKRRQSQNSFKLGSL